MVHRGVFPPSINLAREIVPHCRSNSAYGYIHVQYDFLYFPSVWVCVCAWLTRVPRVQCWYAAYFLCWQRKNIHMIDVFVFSPFAREEEKDGKNRYRCSQWNDQEIDLCGCLCVVCVCKRAQVGLSSLYLFSETSAGWNDCLTKQMASIGWLIIMTAGWQWCQSKFSECFILYW